MLPSRSLGRIMEGGEAAVKSGVPQFAHADGIKVVNELLVRLITKKVDQGAGYFRVLGSRLKLRCFS
jgi:hypothetical protein